LAVESWAGRGFLDDVRAWVARQSVVHGLELTGELEQPHVRPWSSVIRFEASDGRLWFKVNGAGTRHEPALLQVLEQRVSGLLPDVLAVDLERGWSLSRDGGPMLREALPAERSWRAWEGVAVRYAEAQLRLAGHRDAVVATGVQDVTPAAVPEHARMLVEELSALPTDAGGLGADDAGRLSAVSAHLESWSAELASSAVPPSVQHDDLHAGNVCWNGSAATAHIIDWGDTSWAFPLTTMLTTMRSLAFHASLPVDAPEVLRVRDAYLEPFSTFATRADLVHLVDLARRTGCVGRAMAWRSALQGAEASIPAEMGFPVREWLLGLLDR
jgi:hypothetical protein